MKLTFTTDFDGTLDIQPGDSFELKIAYVGDTPSDYHANIIRQTGVRPSPPDLGVSVSEEMGVQERLS